MENYMIVGLGGAAGAVLRFCITQLPVEWAGGFPVKTLGINILGSFVIGLVVALSEKNGLDARLVLFLKVGVCGGFTTFSSFALETQGLVSRGSTAAACLYVGLSIMLGLLAVLAGEKLV